MTDGRLRPNRRRVLAGVGAAMGTALAGCNGLPWEETSTSASVPASDAEAILTASAPETDGPAPITPSADALAAGLERVDDLLAPVPDPLDPADVPNGVVRESIVDARESALERREDAAGTSEADRYRAILTTREARRAAREARTTFRAIDDESVRDDLADEREEALAAVDQRLESPPYRGENTGEGRLRAALVAGRFEADLKRAGSMATARSPSRGDRTVIDVGEAAGGVEFAAATTSVWGHLRERYDASLSDPVDLESTFRSAIDEAVERVQSVDLPDRERDDWLAEFVEDDADELRTETLLYHVARPVYNAKSRLLDAHGAERLGTALAQDVRFECELRALETVSERIDAGDVESPPSVEAVRREREATIDAAETALEEVAEPSPGRHLLTETLQSLAWTDENLAGLLDRADSHVTLGGEYGDYIRLRARFEGVPDAVLAARDRLLAA